MELFFLDNLSANNACSLIEVLFILKPTPTKRQYIGHLSAAECQNGWAVWIDSKGASVRVIP